MIKVLNKFEPCPSGYMEIDTTSKGTNKDLSPFYLGPCVWNDPVFGQMSCKTFENLWQYSKVYKTHCDASGNPTNTYYKWRSYGFNKTRADRYPMGKGKKPLYSLWMGERLSYIDARKRIYIPMYSWLVVRTHSYQTLYNLIMSRKCVALRDFDGYDYQSKNMTMENVINNSTRPMGHAFVIAMLLHGLITPGISVK